MSSADDEDGVVLLKGICDELKSAELKERCRGSAPAIKKRIPFLKNVLTSDEGPKVRSQAAFWIGNQPRPEALSILFEVAQSEARGK